ncbi:MAG: hypothetical protein H0S82_05550 [Anaerolineaceae bacterium]|nr:hypothetical protein [Anaerolineaceae bacterium]
MDAQSVADSPKKLYWYLGDGGLLALFWWGLAMANDPLASAHLWPSLVTALGGLVLAAPVLIWLNASKPADSQNGKKASFWLTLSILYPLALFGLFVWNQLGASPVEWLAFLTHPGMLTVNLAACLLVGTLLNRIELHLHRGISMAAWWLWHLPLIFINGSALLHYHFSTLLMFLYLATVLSLSFWLAWRPVNS